MNTLDGYLLKFYVIILWVLGEKPPPSDSKPNPIPNLTLTLPWPLTGGFFPDTSFMRYYIFPYEIVQEDFLSMESLL